MERCNYFAFIKQHGKLYVLLNANNSNYFSKNKMQAINVRISFLCILLGFKRIRHALGVFTPVQDEKKFEIAYGFI